MHIYRSEKILPAEEDALFRRAFYKFASPWKYNIVC